jgi:hypothetical protein
MLRPAPEISATRPRHRRTGFYVASGLFEGLDNFADLEARIAALPTRQDRGDAFEVFAEAYLVTQKLVGAEEVWPADQIPIAVLQLVPCRSRTSVQMASMQRGLVNTTLISRSSARVDRR